MIHTSDVAFSEDLTNSPVAMNEDVFSVANITEASDFHFEDTNSTFPFDYDASATTELSFTTSLASSSHGVVFEHNIINLTNLFDNSNILDQKSLHLSNNSNYSVYNERTKLMKNEIYFFSNVVNDRYRFRNDGILCRLYGGILSLLNLASVWLVVGLHCDKYCAIASPLRYNQIVTRKRIAVYSLVVWIISLVLSVAVTVLAPDFEYIGGVCLPVWHKTGEIVYTACLAVLLIFTPAVLFALANGKILLIARQHQHRIFSAIFEVMMSAQATVTQQRNPFDMPKMKQKSAWAICEQMIGFAVCYCPLLFYLFIECIVMFPLSKILAVTMVGTLLLAPLVNSFIYGLKSATVKKIFKNYLRKKISRSVMRCEIQARIPSAQNSRRPSISSTLGFPAIHKSLQRRMSDYLSPDDLPVNIPRHLTRRSSDLSWHPLEQGTPTSCRLRQPLDIDLSNSDWPCTGVTTAPHYLAVPTFEASRTYNQTNSAHRQSSSSLESEETFSTKEPATEDELIATSTEISPYRNRLNAAKGTSDRNNSISVSEEEFPMLNGNCHNILSVNMPFYRRESSAITSICSDESHTITSHTPLLCRAYMTPWPKTEPSNANSPYILRTLESLMSVGLSQSRLLKRASLWRGNSFDKTAKNQKKDAALSDTNLLQKPPEMRDNLSCVEIMMNESMVSTQEDAADAGVQESSLVIS